MPTHYILNPLKSQLQVHTVATGMLSFFGHSPTFLVRQFTGDVRFDDETVDRMAVDMTVVADSLDVKDPVSAADRKEITTRMQRDVLETAAYPRIVYQAARIDTQPLARGRYRVRISGQLSLHGVTNPHPIDGELRLFENGLQLLGSSPLKMSTYHIRPVTALGGSIKLQDELKVSFDLIGLPEGT